MARPRLALVGAGSMGANHARVIAESELADLEVIVDTDAGRGEPLAQRLGCRFAPSLEEARGCDGAVLATPTRLHAEQAAALLGQGLPLLVEKPLAPDPDSARVVVDDAAARGLPLMCGFVERFNPAVTTVLDMLDRTPVHVVGLRHSPPTTQSTLSVVADLLIHEIDLALRCMRGAPLLTVASALSRAGTAVAQVADCTLRFESERIATLSASRAAQRKLRLQLIATDEALYEVDLLRQDVTVYRHRGHELTGAQLAYRAETVVDIPFVRHRGEPLALQLQHFVRLLEGGADAATERDSILPAHEVAARVDAGQT